MAIAIAVQRNIRTPLVLEGLAGVVLTLVNAPNRQW